MKRYEIKLCFARLSVGQHYEVMRIEGDHLYLNDGHYAQVLDEDRHAFFVGAKFTVDEKDGLKDTAIIRMGTEEPSSRQFKVDLLGTPMKVGEVYPIIEKTEYLYNFERIKLLIPGTKYNKGGWYVDVVSGPRPKEGDRVRVVSVGGGSEPTLEVVEAPIVVVAPTPDLGDKKEVYHTLCNKEGCDEVKAYGDPEKDPSLKYCPAHGGPAYEIRAGVAYTFRDKDSVAFAVKASEVVPDSYKTTVASYIEKESSMNGQVYTGHVLVTKTISKGEGVLESVTVSEIVFSVDKPFVALNIESAKAQILAEAIVAKKIKTNDPTKPFEVVLK